MPYNYAEYRIRRHTLTKRAHMSEETGPPCKMHQRIRIRIKEYTFQQKIRPRGCQVGLADPLGRPNLAWFPSRCTSRRSGYQGTRSPSICALAGNRPLEL